MLKICLRIVFNAHLKQYLIVLILCVIYIYNLISEFSIDRVNKSGAVFDVAKLNWMNGQYMRNLSDQEYLKIVKPFVEDELAGKYNGQQIEQITLLIKEHLDFASQAGEHLSVFQEDEIRIENDEARNLIKEDTSKTVFSAFITGMDSIDDLNSDTFKQEMKKIQKETGIKGKFLFKIPSFLRISGDISFKPDSSRSLIFKT